MVCVKLHQTEITNAVSVSILPIDIRWISRNKHTYFRIVVPRAEVVELHVLNSEVSDSPLPIKFLPREKSERAWTE